MRQVMVVNGALVGAAGSLAGAVAGLLAWLAYAPRLQASAGHRVDAFNMPWTVICAVMAFAVLTSTVAARRPARDLNMQAGPGGQERYLAEHDALLAASGWRRVSVHPIRAGLSC